MSRRFFVASVGLLVAATSGCGGTDHGRTTTAVSAAEPNDPGSNPPICSVTDGYEFSMLQDFESGAVADGWYFNNDQCDKCQKIIDRIKELNKLLGTAPIEWDTESSQVHADKWGCTDWATVVDPTITDLVEFQAAKAAADAALVPYQQELELRQQQLVAGIPENNVPANCKAFCETTQFPSPYLKPLEASRIEFASQAGSAPTDQPRCASRYAMHVKGGPFTTWGGSFAIQFGHPGLDASQWDGISFWARVGPNSRNPLRIEIADHNTDDKQLVYTLPGEEHFRYMTQDDLSLKRDPDTGVVTQPDYFDVRDDANSWCNNRLFICNGDSTRDDRNGCDKFGANRSMTGDWQFYTIDFSSMRQSGWGRAATNEAGEPDELQTKDLRSLNFMWTTGTWDVWIDDVALYRRKQP